MISEREIKIRQPAAGFFGYNFPAGIFSPSKESKGGFTHVNDYITCREVFHGHFNARTKFIIFTKNNLNIDLINKFFNEIEERLSLKKKTIFHKSNFKNSVLIELSPFWKENSVRRGIFTLFLRCAACHYNGEDVYRALLKYKLTKRIIGPIEWFMKNHTHLAKNLKSFYGGSLIVDELSNYSRSDWESILVK